MTRNELTACGEPGPLGLLPPFLDDGCVATGRAGIGTAASSIERLLAREGDGGSALRTLTLAAAFFWALFPTTVSPAQESTATETRDSTALSAAATLSERPSDRAAVAAIFAEQHTEDSALDRHRRAIQMPIQERFDDLARWVLPNEDHRAFRIHVGFTTTHPPPPAVGTNAAIGGEIVSPALDLIAGASALGRSQELRRRVERIRADSVAIQVDRLAMLALIAMAGENFESAADHLESLFDLALTDRELIEPARDAVLLCVDRASRYPETSGIVTAPAYQILVSYRDVLERTAWQRHFSAAYVRAKRTFESGRRPSTDLSQIGAGGPRADSSANASSQWVPISILRARYRGTGAPTARWQWAGGKAENLWSHDEDYLLFRTPLRGNFSVEGDVRSFGWRETQILLAGKWLGPFHNRASYVIGTVRGLRTRIPFTPPLLWMGDYYHYRTVVRGQVATTYFSGRPIRSESLPPEYEPWVAVRSSPRHDGGVRDLRITGDPQVPQELLLSASSDLPGWVPYFDESIGGAGADWQLRSLLFKRFAEIIGRRQAEYPEGCHKESLLTYHRPMLENGSIEFQFWYEPGRFHAHPALDRLCFLLDPGGVKVHWLTDGPFNRTKLGPDNVVDEPANQRGPDRLPLKADGWNHVRVTLSGDTVDLVLNDELVYQRKLEPTNERVFGLFHYADRTGLRVRNVVWQGEWPRELPPLEKQELAFHKTTVIDQRLPELTAVFSHDFAKEKLPLSQFAVLRGDVPTHVQVKSDGVHAIRPGSGGYKNTTIAPSLKVGGDFDVTATFDRFVGEPAESGKSNIMLLTIADNETADESTLIRRRVRDRGSEQKIVQCIRVRRLKSGVRRNYFAHQTVEANAGRLRLARRKDRMYYLFAEHDSDQFRLVGEESCPTDDLQLEGVRLVMQTYGRGGSTSVVWKSLTVRAEKLSGLAMQDVDALLKKLNHERNELPESFAHDFARQPPDEELFSCWGDCGEWSKSDRGLRIVAPGTDDRTSAGASLKKVIEGDFDISVALTPAGLDLPPESKNSGVYLQVETADKHAKQASIILNKTADGKTEAVAQLRVPNGQDGHLFRRIGGTLVPSVHKLRLARRGKRFYYLAASKEFDGEQVIAHVDVNDRPVGTGGTRILVHAGGAGRRSRVICKTIEVKADRIVSE